MVIRSLALALVALSLALPACTQSGSHQAATKEGWSRYGGAVDPAGTQTVGLAALGATDSAVLLEGTVHEVCQTKGCWMTLRADDGTEVLVRFKDYGFFVPRNAMGRTILAYGVAEKRVLSVEALRHLAEDAGKSPAEIASITEPRESMTFIAEAVWVQGSGLMEPYRPVGQENCPPVDGAAH